MNKPNQQRKLLDQELDLLQTLAKGSSRDWFTRKTIRAYSTSSKIVAKTMDQLLARLSLDGLVTMRRLVRNGRPWGYQITEKGRHVLDEKNTPVKHIAVVSTTGWGKDYHLDEAILKLLLSRPHVDSWKLDALGAALTIPAGATVTAEDILTACEDLTRRGLVILWGDPTDEVGLRIDRTGFSNFRQAAHEIKDAKNKTLAAQRMHETAHKELQQKLVDTEFRLAALDACFRSLFPKLGTKEEP